MRVAGDHIYRIHHSRTAAFAGRLWEDRALHGLYPDSPSLHGQRAGDVADTEEGAGPAGFFFCILCEYGDCAGAVCGNVCGGAVDRGFLSHAGSIVGCPCAEPCPRRKCAAECAAGVCVEAYDLQALLLFDGGGVTSLGGSRHFHGIPGLWDLGAGGAAAPRPVCGGAGILWLTVPFRPVLAFSWQRLKGLYLFGWKMLAENGSMVDSFIEKCKDYFKL